ncbi:MAG: lysophospholipid acyltransferase family protein [Planctomycetota bacterium]
MSASPRTSRFLRWGYRRYLLGGWPFWRGMLAKNFEAVRLLEPVPQIPAGKRAFALNHPGWWDPLAAEVLAAHLTPDRAPVGPMDAEVVRAAPILERLGAFPVEQRSIGGAKAFLRIAKAVLDDPALDLWLTPEGTFRSPDERPLRFAPGLGRLMAADPTLHVIPVAIRYDFWAERRSQLLLAVGEPSTRQGVTAAGVATGDVVTGDAPVRSGECTRFLEGRLTETLDRLTKASISRDSGLFRTLGRPGTDRVPPLR